MPDIKIISIKDIVITIAWPKSGSNIISIKKNDITSNIGNIPFLISFIMPSLLDRYFDTNIVKAILENSDGWIPNGPIPNQERDPFLSLPIPGIRTNINNIAHINNILLAYFL